MDDYNTRQIGETLEILCEGHDAYAECWFGRSYADSPEVDGKVFIVRNEELGVRSLDIGDFVYVEIKDMIDGDLYGEAVAPTPHICQCTK